MISIWRASIVPIVQTAAGLRRARQLLNRRLALVPLMPPLLPADQATLDSLPGLLDQAERRRVEARRNHAKMKRLIA